ncbi:X-Pro dipeptidyl-peptidase domain protein [Frankia canadensis]|uniref:X-Pro dipeptidyl-peptidase domain protein n=1 Tax=Frankia canadensis TaxID=1836972 RepID=A0A2I2KJ35_9ACTN|nr:CocE/NonD family hydrolase [Frankia canadensis]SNQ45682.1 X-Pro dipeptidyl-peptidase domain protein [Frankia canadensis]SOU52972.1 X-Pro dipeptidyl-peptidase domain protein [Frankia canadensis]
MSSTSAAAKRPGHRCRTALVLVAVAAAVAACGTSGAAPPGAEIVSRPTGAPNPSPGATQGAQVHGGAAAGLSADAPRPRASSDAAPTRAAGPPQQTITARDGTVLTATVVVPPVPGRYPLAVIPAAWGFPNTVFDVQAKELSARGYVVLTYNTRGFFSSGGTVDVSGPRDVSDVSDVISWALAHTPADPARVGVAGLSYGGGIALLAAAADARVRTVASLSGWTDFGYSLYAADTRHKAALDLLTSLLQKTGRSGADFTTFLDDYNGLRNMPSVLAWAKARSAGSLLDAVNRHHPAVFMAAAYGDNFFAPNPQIDFFTGLTGPKSLQLAPGDHGTNEIGGLLGIPNGEWSSAWDWFDRGLRPGSPSAAAHAPAAVRLTTDGGGVETYPTWAAATRSTTTLRLGPAPLGTGDLSPTAATGSWSTSIRSGTDTTANAGTVLITKALQGISHLPPTLRLDSVDRRDGAVWQAPPTPLPQRIRGIPTLRLSLTPNVDTGTVVAYLYATSPTGDSTLLSKAVHTYLGAKPGQPQAATLAFDPVATDVLTGCHLSLVIDTKDDLYLDMDRAGGTVAFGSPSAQPSQLSVPLG